MCEQWIALVRAPVSTFARTRWIPHSGNDTHSRHPSTGFVASAVICPQRTSRAGAAARYSPAMPTRRDILTGALGGAAGAFLASRTEAGQALARLEADAPTLGRRLRDRYDLAPGLVYLNHASIGTTPRAVRQNQARLLALCETNPHEHVWGDAFAAQADEARRRAGNLIAARPDEVAILRTTTEAMSILAGGLPLAQGDEVLFSTLNHDGASEGFRHWADAKGYTVRSFDFPILDAPSLTPDDIVEIHARQIRDETRLLVFPHVDNIIGLRHPAAALVRAARDRGVEWVAVDGAQTVGMLPVDVGAIGADFYATSAHKWVQSPKAFGLLHLRAGAMQRVRPLIVTWGRRQWRGTARVFEDYGTRDLASIIAMGDAAAWQRALGVERALAHRLHLADRARRRVDATPGLAWRSPRHASLASAVFSIGVEGRDVDELARSLFRDHAIVCRPFRGINALRISVNAANDEDDLDALWRALGV